jgi:hypothetical protein
MTEEYSTLLKSREKDITVTAKKKEKIKRLKERRKQTQSAVFIIIIIIFPRCNTSRGKIFECNQQKKKRKRGGENEIEHHVASCSFAHSLRSAYDYSSSMTTRQKELMANKDAVTVKEEDLTIYSQVTKSVLPF